MRADDYLGIVYSIRDFPSFSEGLSLRVLAAAVHVNAGFHFPSFSEGLSLRDRIYVEDAGLTSKHFPSFSEGLSLRVSDTDYSRGHAHNFPSFSEGLSLRGPHQVPGCGKRSGISLPFRRDFH